MKCFTIYQLMFLILDEINDENNDENLIRFLTDANPFMRDGEASVDEIVYNDFSNKYSSYNNRSDFGYEFICYYLKNLNSYYGDIYSIFRQLNKDEYVETCNNILKNYPTMLKNGLN